MRILTLSDTHTKHNQIPLRYLENKEKEIKMIIHAGDISGRGNQYDIVEFLKWYNDLNFMYKILIPGNHDFYFERASDNERNLLLSKYPNVIYLHNSGVNIEGINIWGSGATPFFYNWAFNFIGDKIKPYWDMIPIDINILITHGPVRGYLDRTLEGELTGCPYLLDTISNLKELKYHICGHIHEGYGRVDITDTCEGINASVLDRNYVMRNAPIEIIIDK